MMTAVLALSLALVTVRYPALDGLEEAVAGQLAETRTRLEDAQKTGTPSAERFAEAGRTYHAYAMTDPAEDCYRNAAALDPAAWQWPYLLALVLEQANRPEAAAAQLERVLDREEKYYPAILRLASLRLTLGNLEEAQRLLRIAVRHAPDDPALLAVRGELALAQDRPAEAAADLARALEREPRATRLHYPLALAYRKLGRLAEAETEAGRVGSAGIRARDPLLDEVLARRRGVRVHALEAERAFAAGDYQAAFDAYERALRSGEASVALLLPAAVSATKLGRYADALDRLERAARLAPEDDRVAFNRAVLLVHVGRREEAVPLLQQVLEHNPHDTDAGVELVLALAALQRDDQADALAAHIASDAACSAFRARRQTPSPRTNRLQAAICPH